ncbi:MAG: hypothetical protein JZU50_01115 [Desulfobulbaceae bacterium]|nr:hypothetical protein [Desulfobulbaceae bacterium]
MRQSLQHEGWWSTANSTGSQPGAHSLYDVPITIASWERFDQLFAWEQRPYGERQTMGATYLGAAVRSFFAQGGRKCYVISCGEPVALDADYAAREAMLLQLVPDDTGQRSDRSQWHGLHHLFGLPGASMVALPDLAELAGVYREATATPIEVPPPLPEFLECSQPTAVIREEKEVLYLAAPTCTDTEYDRWRTVIHRAARFLADHRRDMQLLAALPMPQRESTAASGLLAFMHQRGWLSGALSAQSCPAISAGLSDADQEACSIASAFVQLGYPWLQAGYAGDLPANLEPPEGVMAGLLARNALTRGTFCSATPLALHDLVTVAPQLRQSQQFGLNPKAPLRASPQAPLIDRVSLLGPTPEGFRLLSDVTTHNHSNYRQANISRTIGLVMRVARSIGEEYVFESSGERLWGQLRARLEDVLEAMQRVGALAGTGSEEAFAVRCDRSTMTRQDIDQGRVIVEVLIRPAASIETMRIQLAFGDGGHVALSSLGMEAA